MPFLKARSCKLIIVCYMAEEWNDLNFAMGHLVVIFKLALKLFFSFRSAPTNGSDLTMFYSGTSLLPETKYYNLCGLYRLHLCLYY